MVIILGLTVFALYNLYKPMNLSLPLPARATQSPTYVVCNGQTYNLNQNPLACDTTSNSGYSNVVFCQDSYYTVYTGYYTSDSTGHGTVTTHSSNTSFTTTTSVTQTVGYVTSTENNYTGTLTGAIAEWTVSACTYTTSP
jgi:hypothetical protein